MKITYTKNGKSWRPFRPEDEGSAYTVAKVTMLDRCHFVIEAEQYYFKDGVLKLEITQHLDRALNTFGALLLADSREYERDSKAGSKLLLDPLSKEVPNESIGDNMPCEARHDDDHSKHF